MSVAGRPSAASAEALLQALAQIPRLGWVPSPSPVQSLDDVARERTGPDRAPASFTVKRDDQIATLGGATKVRKFDTLFAQDPWASASHWVTVGAIGSGHVRATGAAAAELGTSLHAVLFDESISAGVLDNLAWTATLAHRLSYVGSRVELALRHPRALFATRAGGAVTIPPGATTPWGTVGIVCAVAELVAQVERGELPRPERLYVAYGSGGTVAGLAYGLSVLAPAWKTEVHAVRVVEGPLAPFAAIAKHAAGAADVLRAATGAPWPSPSLSFVPRSRFLGRGYGVASPAALAAVEALAPHGLALEPVYTGKAMGALLHDLDRGELQGAHVLFWNTRRGPLPDAPPAWRDALPRRLSRRLDGRGRRRAMAIGGGAALALGGAALLRTHGYAPLRGFESRALANWEGHVFAAAAEALFAEGPADRPSNAQIAASIDRFVVGMPPDTLQQIRGLCGMIEHGTALGGRSARFTRLTPAQRLDVLRRIDARGGVLADAVRGLRDLVYAGAYQSPAMWPGIGYEGPLVAWQDGASRGRDGLPPAPSATYDRWRARAGALPRSAP